MAIAELQETRTPRATLSGSASLKQKIRRRSGGSHSLRVADLVLVAPGSIPITTSGKIARSAVQGAATAGRFPDWTLTYDGALRQRGRLRNWLVDYLVTNIGCSPDDIDFDALAERSGRRVARRGRALR